MAVGGSLAQIIQQVSCAVGAKIHTISSCILSPTFPKQEDRIVLVLQKSAQLVKVVCTDQRSATRVGRTGSPGLGAEEGTDGLNQ